MIEPSWRPMVEMEAFIRPALAQAELEKALAGQPTGPDAASAWAWWLFSAVRQAPEAALPAAVEKARAGFAAAGSPGPHDAELLRDAVAYADARMGRLDAAWEALRGSLAAAHPGRPAAERGIAQFLASMVLMRRGRFEEALRHAFDHLEGARAAGDDVQQAVALHQLGLWQRMQFNLDDAKTSFEASIEALSRRIGARMDANTAMSLVAVLRLLRRVDEAHALMRRWLEQPGGPLRGVGEIRDWSAGIAQVLIEVGRLDEAEGFLALGSQPTARVARKELHWTVARANWLMRKDRHAEAKWLCESWIAGEAQRPITDDPQIRMQLYETIEACSAEVGDIQAERAAARSIRRMLLPMVSRSARAQMMTMRVLRDASRCDDAAVAHAQRQAAIDESTRRYAEAVVQFDAPRDASGEPPGSRPFRDPEMLAALSHELRTPLNGVLGLTSMLLMTKLDEQQRRLAGMTQYSAQQMLRMVNDIVDLARVESGLMRLERTRVELRPLLERLPQVFEPERAAKPGLSLKVAFAPDVPEQIEADGGRLAQLLLNLLSNAMKATSSGEIRLQVRRLAGGDDPEGALRFEVADTGCGIAHEDQQRLFRIFSQAGPEATRKLGSGLGLALCAQLATLMGGSVGFESTFGEGSRFWLDLPIAALQPA